MDANKMKQITRRPLSVQETALTMGLLSELALKLIYNAGEIGASEISRQICLPFAGVMQPVLEVLDREELVNIIGTGGFGE